jgi:hypothetical protein
MRHLVEQAHIFVEDSEAIEQALSNGEAGQRTGSLHTVTQPKTPENVTMIPCPIAMAGFQQSAAGSRSKPVQDAQGPWSPSEAGSRDVLVRGRIAPIRLTLTRVNSRRELLRPTYACFFKQNLDDML